MKKIILTIILTIGMVLGVFGQSYKVSGDNLTITMPNTGEYEINIDETSIYKNVKNIDIVGKGEYSLNISNLEKLEVVKANQTGLRKVDINNCSKLIKLEADECLLKSDSISLTNCPAFERFIVKRNKLTHIDFLSHVLKKLWNVQINGGAPTGQIVTKPTNVIREIRHEQLCDTIGILLIRHNLIEELDLKNKPKLRKLEAQSNRLWALNLDECKTNTTWDIFNVHDQRTFKEVEIHKGSNPDGSEDEIRLYIPLANYTTFYTDRVTDFYMHGEEYNPADVLKIDGTRRYFKIPTKKSAKYDEDHNLHNEKVTYIYDTKAKSKNVLLDDRRLMDVTATIDPYVLYINAKTKSGVDYYSSTLYLDYDCIVPRGVEAYIATGITDPKLIIHNGTSTTSAQLNLVLIGEEGDTIPAYTPMYIKANDAAGLYAFYKTWEPEYIGWLSADSLAYIKKYKGNTNTKGITQELLNQNILTGTLSEITIEKRSVLTLGLETQKGTLMIGFWPYNGTNIRHHRCYITEDKLKNVKMGESKGVSFTFSNPVTNLNNYNIEDTKENVWYNIYGQKLPNKPTQRGIYIYNDKKYIIK